MKNYGQAIKTLRKSADMTQSELAKNLNVTYQTVSKWETGINTPDISVIESMCALFDVGVEEFLRLADGETESAAAESVAESEEQTTAPEEAAPSLPPIEEEQNAPAGGARAAKRKKLAVKPLYIVLAAIIGVAVILTAVLMPVLLLRDNSEKPLSASKLYAEISPSVFCVECVTAKGTEEGSGFFIDDVGTAVVDTEVIFGARASSVRLHDGSVHAIDRVLGRDIDRGLAVVHVDVEKSVPVKLSERRVNTGKNIYVIGYFERFELGSESAIRNGVVSSAAFSIDNIDYIRISVETSGVCRGGVLADEFGNVIGVVKYGVFDGKDERADIVAPISAVFSVEVIDMPLDEYAEEYGHTVSVTYSLYGVPYFTASLALGERVPQIDFSVAGAELLGWYADPEFSTPFDFSIRPEESTTLYAKCAFDEYTVRFDGGNGAKGYMQDITAEKGKGFTLPENGFTKTGYTFSGWRVGGTVYQEGDAVADQSGPIVTAEAVWTPVRYNVRFACGEDGFTVSYTYGEKHFAPSTVYERTGYTHDGWRVGDTVYKHGEVMPDLASENGATVTVAAEMTPISYTMQIDLNATGDVYVDGERYRTTTRYVDLTCYYGEHPFETHSVTQNYMTIEKVTVFADDGAEYVCDLRYVNSDPDRTVKARIYWLSGAYTLEVHSTCDDYIIGWADLTGREECTLPLVSELLSSLGDNLFSIPDGYSFSHWKIGEGDSSKATFADGATVSDLLKYDYVTSGNEVVVRLYPVLSPVSYTLTFDGNGGVGSMSSVTCAYDEDYVLPACGFTRDGYVFGGWRCGSKRYADRAKVKNLTTKEEALTLSVQWVKSYSGSGTAEDPYRIGTYAELKDFSYFVTCVDGMNAAHYVLTADIDCEGGELYAAGTDDRRFSGVFDGGSHVIENALFVATDGYKGLFGYVYDGQIKNVGIKNYTFETIKKDETIAPLACKYYSTKPISSCFAEGEIEIVDIKSSYYDDLYISGLVGELCGKMTNCYSHCDFSASFNVSALISPSYWYDVTYSYGGLVTSLIKASTVSPTWPDGSKGPKLNITDVGMKNCYSYGDVNIYIDPEIQRFSPDQKVGLLIAKVDSGISNSKLAGCFTAGTVTCNIAWNAYSYKHSQYVGTVVGSSSEMGNGLYSSAEMTYGGDHYSNLFEKYVTIVDDSSLRSLSWLTENLSFDDNVWAESPDGYPTLKAYSNTVE